MGTSIVTPEDRHFLDSIYRELCIARQRGRQPVSAILLSWDSMPVSLPIPILSPSSTLQPKPDVKDFDPEDTVCSDASDTLTDDDVPIPQVGRRPPNSVADNRETTVTEDAILEILTMADKPMKATTIALRAGLNCTNHFRRTLYGLAKKAKILATDDHKYSLAD